jgi:hypothetical protein
MHPKKCLACYRKASENSKYCLYHDKAYQNLTDHYTSWMNAYGRISFEDFMIKLSSIRETGRWIKEVISVELKGKKESTI